MAGSVVTLRLGGAEAYLFADEQIRALLDKLWAASGVPGAAFAATEIALARRIRQDLIDLDEWQSQAVRVTGALDAALNAVQ